MGIVEKLRGGLIVSCQARPGSPFRDSAIMAAMARAAEIGGAVGVRVDGPEDIAAIRAAVRLPIIGIYKQQIPGVDVYITPTLDAARRVVSVGADLLAVDATARPRPGGVDAGEMIRSCKAGLGVPVMADVSTLEEGIEAARAGADLVATTLVGYTSYSQHVTLPDFDLVRDLVAAVSVPVVVEGHISTPADVQRAIQLGAYAVVVGAAITQPEWITRRFVEALPGV